MAQDSLQRYRQKRDPARTPEPFGGSAPGRARALASGGMFVVQQHAARRLHWDVRLEIGGALVSWAVPRGPTLDPKERRLAVQTEDHPLEYADFEGIIPPGNYGAGAMIVWDRGTFHTVDDTATADGLASGKLDLEMQGHKLRGRWALVRTKGEGGKAWLLIKKASSPPAGPELVIAQPRSVLSGLTIEELRDGLHRTAAVAARAAAAGAPRRRLDAATLQPMLADTAERAFSRDGWIYELKYDGVRVLAQRDAQGQGRLYYRTQRDTTAVFPEIARAIAHLPCDDVILDGEVVTIDEHGASSFERLQKRLGLTDTASVARAEVEVPVVMVAFDLLAATGYDLRTLPLTTRKELLQSIVPPVGVIRFADHIEREGEAFFAVVNERGLEGIVAKRADAPYHSGRRSRDWLKVKALRSAHVAIVGYLHGKGSRAALGSVMVAWQKDGELLYAGNVGSGFDANLLRDLRARLESRRRATPAFVGTPPGPARTHVFVEPALVAEVRYSEVTQAGALRQPVFVRLRDDLTPANCGAPHPAPPHEPWELPNVEPRGPELRLTNVDKIFWPEDGYTKGDLLHYYEQIWPALAPYLRDRPVVLTRYPDGIEGKNFFQKNAPAFTPQWVETFRIEDTDYFICNERETLLYVINSGCIPIHVWSARRGTLERPDWSILDLDPKGAPFRQVVAVAHIIHQLLDELHVPHFAKTSGQDGLHVLVPLGCRLTHAEARTFAEVIARVVVAEHADIATVARPLGERGGKVYIDFLQNGFGKTIASPFSVRPRPCAPVSTPLEWRAVHARLDPTRWNIRTVPPRFHDSPDPMRAVLGAAADVPAALETLARRVG